MRPYGVLMGELAHTDKVNPMWMHGNNLNSYVAWFVGTVVGTALGGLPPNPEIFGARLCFWLGCLSEFLLRRPDYAKTDSVRNLLIILAVVCGVLLFTLNSGVSVASCSVCDLARLYNGVVFRWSVSEAAHENEQDDYKRNRVTVGVY